jgi:hypothetical protein
MTIAGCIGNWRPLGSQSIIWRGKRERDGWDFMEDSPGKVVKHFQNWVEDEGVRLNGNVIKMDWQKISEKYWDSSLFNRRNCTAVEVEENQYGEIRSQRRNLCR